MGINFPASPADGQYFAAPQSYGTGPLYRYLASKNVWQKAAGTASRFNKFVNPAMQIAQERSGTAPIANGGYAADQWVIGYNGLSGIQATRIPSAPGPTPNGNQVVGCYIGVAKATFGAGEYFTVGQPIEGNRLMGLMWGTASARYAVLRFWVWIKIAGTYTAVIRNGAVDRSWIGPFTISAAEAGTWQMRSFVVPGDITGTWPTDNTMGLTFTLLFGGGAVGVPGWQAGNKSSVAGMGNACATADWNIFVGDFGLYADPLCTGVAPEFQAPELADDMQDCLRYWYPGYRFDGVVASATQGYAWMANYVPMRTGPAMTLVGSIRATDISVSPNIVSFTPYNVSSESTSILLTASGYTASRPLKTLVDGQLVNYIACSARM